MKSELPESTRQALHYLLQTAAADKVVVAGFAFSINPIAITSFGNCVDKTDLKLYELLCRMIAEKRQAGLVIIDDVQKPV